MANHKSALKRARQNQLRRLRNRAVKTRVKSVVKDVRNAVAENSADTTDAKLRVAQAAIHKAAKKCVLHKRTAARKIARLSRLTQTIHA